MSIKPGEVQVQAQEVTCELRRINNEVVGECRGIGDSPVGLRLQQGDGNARWSGALEMGDQADEIDIVAYQYADGPTQVLRTPFGWVIPRVMDFDANPPELAWSLSDEAPPSRTDLLILDHARELLRDENVWDRADDRVCASSDEIFSLYCALVTGVQRVTGEYQHRQPALQIVRRVVGDRWRNRVINHRLMDFNNDPATTFAEVLGVLAEARAEIASAMR